MYETRKIKIDHNKKIITIILLISLIGFLLGITIFNNFIKIHYNFNSVNPVVDELELLGFIGIIILSIEIFFIFALFFTSLKLYIKHRYNLNLIQVLISGVLNIKAFFSIYLISSVLITFEVGFSNLNYFIIFSLRNFIGIFVLYSMVELILIIILMHNILK